MNTARQPQKGLSPRTVLIIVIPLILVLLLLNTGTLQKYLPAVTVGERSYTIAQFHYYFYNAYYDFVNEHAQELDDFGLDLTQSLKKQTYDGDRTWQDYFRDCALETMRETTILLSAADRDNFQVQAEVESALAAKEAELTQYCMDSGINGLSTYFTSYYEVGMTSDTYFACFAEQTRAELYYQQLSTVLTPSEEELEALPALQSGQPVSTVNLLAALFSPATDRTTGISEAHQWDNAQILAQAFLDRWTQRGGTQSEFEAMAATYSQWADGPGRGVLTSAGPEDLDPAVADWCFSAARTPGDTALIRGDSGWWAVFYAGPGEDGRLTLARRQELEQRYHDWQMEQGSFSVSTHMLGMTIAL